MSESVRKIHFEHFRGLPANDFELRGKSLVLLGGNGKGKSGLVDGFEFLFSGQVGRFTGAGSGRITHDDAVKNVKTGGDPKVTLSLSPSNGEITRALGSKAPTITDRPEVKDYFDQHPGVDAFILRRAKILDFVCDQDADRYRKFVQLLGITRVDTLQRAFVDAERQAQTAADRAKMTHETKLAVFNDPVAEFAPKNLSDVVSQISVALESFGLERLRKWSEVELGLPLLKAKRPEANKEKVDGLTRVLVSIETPLPLAVDEDVATANQLRVTLERLNASSADAPRSKVIDEGSAYLSAHKEETHCPLCEAEFDLSIEDVLSRLKERSDALGELREASSKRKAALSRVKRYADDVAAQLKKDLEHVALLDNETTKTFRNATASALRFSRSAVRAEAADHDSDLEVPERLATIIVVRGRCATKLTTQRTALVPPDSSKLEAAIALLERGIASHEEIGEAEQAISSSAEILRRATLVKEAFTKCRENAIQKVFTHIAGTVLDYYRRLHDFNESTEQSECTDLELKSTSRAAAGGLRLAIQFLGLAHSKDPRAFLSDGHLDSLGLCLFLATVRIFNPPGSLLVLDDVLTSIDKEHRARVGELLFSEFNEYQIILTTHDEYWYQSLRSSARALGIQKQWRYISLESWTIDSGPMLSVVKSSWDFVLAHLNDKDYRNLGGPFRFMLEDFLKRTASKIELEIKYKNDGAYTAGDFVNAGIQDKIRDELIKKDSSSEAAIKTDVLRVFGQGNLINDLSHDNIQRLEITLTQAKDFVSGLKSLTKRCEEHKLIKGQ